MIGMIEQVSRLVINIYKSHIQGILLTLTLAKY